jgi:hypothetical protein
LPNIWRLEQAVRMSAAIRATAAWLRKRGAASGRPAASEGLRRDTDTLLSKPWIADYERT